jgi:hypothetical protein
MDTYFGTRQLQATATATLSGTGASLTPLLVTSIMPWADIQSELIEVDGVTVAEAGGTFAANANYNFTSPAGLPVSQIRVEDNSEVVGDTIPNAFNIIGICTQYSSTGQIQPRIDADIIAVPPSSVEDWTIME